MKKPRWVGIFGGSFNPPHLGHLLAALYALKVFEFDEIWLLPSYRHAFGKKLPDFVHRYRMCQRLVRNVGSKIKVSSIEQDLESDGRMLNTLQAFRKKYRGHHFSLVIGSDLLRQRKKWYRFKEIERRFSVYVIPRGASHAGTIAIPNISSTEIRKRIRTQQPLEGLLTADVAAYIRSKKVYGK